MTAVFADSFFYFALLNRRDQDHQKALEFAARHTGTYFTTAWVLTEVADGMSHPAMRTAFADFFDDLERDSNVTIEHNSESVFRQGLGLYRQRDDKDWSLTDCISFFVMRREAITEALTGDHHFEQAGFIALLK